jgi:hypothetical protein
MKAETKAELMTIMFSLMSNTLMRNRTAARSKPTRPVAPKPQRFSTLAMGTKKPTEVAGFAIKENLIFFKMKDFLIQAFN